MMKCAFRIISIVFLLSLLMLLGSSVSADTTPNAGQSATAAATVAVTAKVQPLPASGVLPLTGVTYPVHDPVLIKDGSQYVVFATGQGIPLHCSPDMLKWDNCGKVFRVYPYWVYKAVPNVTDIWAPDISFWNGKYYLYYAASSFGSNRSVIGLATNVTLDQDRRDYKWVDEGEIIGSQPADDFNAIDPNLVTDQDGQRWLALGSFWTGIKLIKLDATTGKRSADDKTVYSLASRPGSTQIEASFIIYRGGYYYLFVSFDMCCRGVDSNYKMMVGRSAKVTGPYVDRDGRAMLDGSGSLVYAGSERWHGPGHNAIYQENGVYYLVYHSYDAEHNGSPTLRIEALEWDAKGWPVSPSATALATPNVP